jgi:propanediol utilization protein
MSFHIMSYHVIYNAILCHILSNIQYLPKKIQTTTLGISVSVSRSASARQFEVETCHLRVRHQFRSQLHFKDDAKNPTRRKGNGK